MLIGLNLIFDWMNLFNMIGIKFIGGNKIKLFS